MRKEILPRVRTFVAAFALIATSSSLLALHDTPTSLGVKSARAALVLNDDDDEVSVEYRTLFYGEANRQMTVDENARNSANSYITSVVRGSLVSDVTLKYDKYELPAGRYTIGFALDDKKEWLLLIYRGQQLFGSIRLELRKSAIHFPYLNMSLCSTSAETVRLVIQYGDDVAAVDAQVVVEDES